MGKNVNRLVILMYHALYEDERGLQEIPSEDRPYALSTAEFAAHLDLLQASGVPIADPHRLELGDDLEPGIMLSFDDGHASHTELALPLLVERGLTAVFFVTTGFVNARPGYCSWQQIERLCQAGMTVGGHGHTHRFLSDLSDTELANELSQSRSLLEDALGRSITQLSFPGGRHDSRSERAARAAGYRVLYGSRVGWLRTGSPAPACVLPRMAVRRGATASQVLAYANAGPTRMLRARLAFELKRLVRQLLGNKRYHKLYARLKG